MEGFDEAFTIFNLARRQSPFPLPLGGFEKQQLVIPVLNQSGDCDQWSGFLVAQLFARFRDLRSSETLRPIVSVVLSTETGVGISFTGSSKKCAWPS